MSVTKDTSNRLIKFLESIRSGNEVVDILNVAIALSRAHGTSADFIHANGSVVFTANQSLNGHKITNLANPTDAQDAATKSYVDLNGNGTVTSVGLTMPTELFVSPVSGSPITTSGILGPALATQAANLIFASPISGGAAIPTFRSLVSADVPILNQNTTGSAAKWATARNLAGNSVDGSINVAFSNKFIVQGTTDAGLSGAQFLGALSTGILKNTTTTGVLSIAVAGDFPTLNQNTTGLSSNVTGIVALANGGTGLNSASLNALLNSLLPNQSTNAGKFLTTDGNNASWASSGSSGANTSLSNLSAVNINSDLLTAFAVNIGSFDLLFNRIFVAEVSSDNFTGLNPGTALLFQPATSTDPGTSGGISFLTAQPLGGEDSGPIEQFTHNVTGTAQSGSFTSSTGTSTGGNSGEHNVRTGDAVISGDINIGTGQGSTRRGDVLPSGRRIVFTADEYIVANSEIRNVSAPTQAGSATNKTYVDNAVGSSIPLTTKGDILGFSTVKARVPVGTDGQVLTADSAQPLGIKWATPGGGGSPTHSIQSMSAGGIINSSFDYVQVGLTATTPPTPSMSDITTTPATGLAGKSFYFNTLQTNRFLYQFENTLVTSNLYYVWYTVDGSGSDPASSGIGIRVDLLSSDDAAAVATKTKAAIVAFPVTGISAITTVSPTQFTFETTILGQGPNTVPQATDIDTGFTFGGSTGNPSVWSHVTLDPNTPLTNGTQIGKEITLEFFVDDIDYINVSPAKHIIFPAQPGPPPPNSNFIMTDGFGSLTVNIDNTNKFVKLIWNGSFWKVMTRTPDTISSDLSN